MNFKAIIRFLQVGLLVLIILSCSDRKNHVQFEKELELVGLTTGEIALCRSGTGEFGSVLFSVPCSEKVKADFNLGVALLHSFEYTEAEKVFAKVIDEEPGCVMAYWGAAMCNFHPLWSQPSQTELQKGARIISLARSMIQDTTTRESNYLEAIATIYDQWNTLDHRTRLLKYEHASQRLFEQYPTDDEAAIFYALALDATVDPTDKTFHNQKKAGSILNKVFRSNPNHPGITHYIIHNYDYPELADQALPAARKYASIATASAHAQHMPSHIFTRLGLWTESVQSNLTSISAAQCYAENTGIKGHWDEELHGMDYLIYAHLQKAEDDKAAEQIAYLNTIREVFPVNFKCAYSFASMPARYVVERKDWTAAANLALHPVDFPWEKFLWEKANINFARLLGAVHIRQMNNARDELEKLKSIHLRLIQQKETYKANLVQIQVKASEGWIRLAAGQTTAALKLMREAANMEDETSKHPVTPGAIIPARELLGDMYMETGDPVNALKEYELVLKTHPNRFNGIYGAGLASEKAGDMTKARRYAEKLDTLAGSSISNRPQLAKIKSFQARHTSK